MTGKTNRTGKHRRIKRQRGTITMEYNILILGSAIVFVTALIGHQGSVAGAITAIRGLFGN